MFDTINDILDKRDTITKWRSFAEPVPFRTLDQRFNSDGTTFYSWNDTNTTNGWHQQTSSLENKRWIAYKRQQRAKYSSAYARRRPRNMGGPFITTKLWLELPGQQDWNLLRTFINGNPQYLVQGTLFPHLQVHRLYKAIFEGSISSHATWTEDDSLSISDLRLAGEKLMLSVVPTSTVFNAVTALGEPISDGGFFGLPGRQILNANPGSEFLNFQFGIVPTIGDIQNLNTALNTYQKVISQYLRDANKRIRRRTLPYDLPEEVTVESFATPPVTAGGRAVTSFLADPITVTKTTRTNRKIWYAGEFEYFVPKNLSAFEQNLFEWQRAYHFAPSPSDVWELLPFSWLADYFTNGGDAIRHLFLQTSEGAVQVYGYVMCTSEVTITYEWHGLLKIANTFQPRSITAVVHKTIKQRARVSPFGVNFTGVALSPRQLAILAALGIAR